MKFFKVFFFVLLYLSVIPSAEKRAFWHTAREYKHPIRFLRKHASYGRRIVRQGRPEFNKALISNKLEVHDKQQQRNYRLKYGK